MDDSTIICDEVIKSYDEEIKSISTNFNKKNTTFKAQNFCILLVFLLITIALLIAICIYCYLMNYRANQKHLLSYRDTKLKQFCVRSIN